VSDVRYATSGEGHLVPETLPPTQPLPEPVRQIAFLNAFLFHWVLPHRLGPHLAVGSVLRSIVAMAVSVWFTSAIVVYCVFSHIRDEGFRLSNIRETFAYAILLFAAKTAHSSQHWIPVALVVLGPVIVGIVASFFGMLIAPWCVDGDNFNSAVRRSMKNALWATTVLIPGAVVWAVVYLSNAGHDHVPEWDPFTSGVWNLSPPTTPFDENVEFMVYRVVPTTVVAHFLVCLFFGAGRYVGPPVGPGFESRFPLCERCGYRVVELAVKGNCPECSYSISASLSIRVSPWQSGGPALRLWRRAILPLRITSRVLTERNYLCRISMRSNCSPARTFSTITSIAMMTVIIAVAQVCTVDWHDSKDRLLCVVTLALIPVAAKVVMMIVAGLWARFRFGMPDGRIPLNICCYASCLLWPAVLAISGVSIAVARFGLGDVLLIERWEFNVAAFVIGVGALVTILGSFANWCVRVFRALQAARFANF